MRRIVLTTPGAGDVRLRHLTAGVPPHCIELAQRGRLVLGERVPTGAWARPRLPIKAVGGASIVTALLAEREEGR